MATAHTNINDFVAHVKKNGVAVNNRFDILLTLPDYLAIEVSQDQSFKNFNGKSLSLMATSVISPGVSVSTTEMRLGVLRKIPYDKSTGELDVVFRCSGDMAEKKLFDKWISMMFSEQHTLEYYENYTTDLEISAVNNSNSSIYTDRYTEVYPSIITPLTYDRENQNTVLSFQVTFLYRKVYHNDKSNSFLQGKKITTKTAKFGNADPRIKVKPTLPFIAAIPGLSAGQSQQVVDMWRQIERVRSEISRGGLTAAGGAQLIASITRSVRASLGEGMPGDAVNVALEYLNDAAFLLKRK